MKYLDNFAPKKRNELSERPQAPHNPIEPTVEAFFRIAAGTSSRSNTRE